jgi:uncharacterized protein (TIGR03000 family)
MYSIVLATMLTTGTAAPDWGCRGCCGGCWGCCGGCWGCCGGCFGCCGGCWGCCGGCWGGWWPGYGWGSAYPYPYGGWGVGFYGSCYGCWGTCFGCHGCYGCYGCYGACYGGVAVAVPTVAPAAVVPVTPVAPVLPVQPKKEEEKKKSMSLGNAAEVVVKAPAGVQLSVEDRDLPRTVGEQAFRTPELEPGYAYTYTFKARVVREGKTVSYTKQVRVRAGESATADFTKLATEGKDAAKITVKLPADARLYVDGTLCPLTSELRTFTTPELDAGQKYYYTLKAEVVRGGETRTSRKRVIVEAGKDVTVEFTDLPLQTVSR